jgi:uncharacterized membrane protein YhhN
MTTSATIFLLVAAGCMATDWWSLATRRDRVETVAKPAVMLALLGLTIAADIEPSARPWILVALSFGLVGDIALLPRLDRFIVGLSAFLVGHLAYSVAFTTMWSPSPWILAGLVGIVTLILVAGRPIERALRGSALHLPVLAYIAVTGIVVVTGAATGRPLIVAGTLAFAASDGLLGAGRFLDDTPDRRVWIHVLYQLGQTAIVLGTTAA